MPSTAMRAKSRHCRLEDVDALAGNLGTIERGTGDITAGMGEVRDDTRAYRILDGRNYDRDRRGRSFCRDRHHRADGDDDVGIKLHQLGSKRFSRRPTSLKVPVFDFEILPLDITKFPQTIFQGFDEGWKLRS